MEGQGHFVGINFGDGDGAVSGLAGVALWLVN